MEARYTANAVFSPSKSFVRLEPVATKLSCDTTLQVQTHYILNGEAVQELKELIFHYLVRRALTALLPTDKALWGHHGFHFL